MATESDNNDFWRTFGVSDQLEEITCEYSTGLASAVCNYYDVPVKAGEQGGTLPDIDIHHMDAIQVMKMSLLESSASTNLGAIYEPSVNHETNEVEFKAVGDYSGSVSDIYHTIQTSTYKDSCKGVMVIGKKPRTYRKTDVEWTPVWGEGASNRRIYDMEDMLDNCNRENFKRQAIIAYQDPNLTTQFNDGIDNLYEIDLSNPYDSVAGYAVQKNSKSDYMNPEVTIADSNMSSIPIKVADGPLPDIGTLVRRPTIETEDAFSEECWADFAMAPENARKGVPIIIPEIFRYDDKWGDKIDNFIQVSQVYVLGKELRYCGGRPKDDASALQEPTEENTAIWVKIDSWQNQVFKLQPGYEYVIAFDEDEDPIQPYIVFSNGSKDYDKGRYGNNTTYNIYPTCRGAQSLSPEQLIGVRGTILPVSGNAGILVEQVYAIVDLEVPSLTVTDPKGHALDIANNLEYMLLPLVIVDEYPPIGFNGAILDQTQGIQDHDPTTVQNFEDTPYELAIDQMDGGGGLTLNLTFLDTDQVRVLSRNLYEYMNSGDGIETVYVCGPNCKPEVGGYGPSGGIINSVSYQYTDSGSYTISVTEGARIIGGVLSDITGGPTPKRSESVSVNAKVIQDLGTSVFFKVRLDGFGDRLAINISSNIIRAGDKVQCTIHNAPIES